MSNAAARVLELFLRTRKQGVTGVTHVTGRSVTYKGSAVTMVTPVTYQKQQGEEPNVTSTQSDSNNAEQTSIINFEERAAIAEYDGGAPRAWAEALARLDLDKPPGEVPARRWLRFVDDCGRFLDDGWARQAAAFGWGARDLFGCDRERPYARVDRAGLLWLLNGRKLVAFTAETATIETLSGAHQTYRRGSVAHSEVTLPWTLGLLEGGREKRRARRQ